MSVLLRVLGRKLRIPALVGIAALISMYAKNDWRTIDSQFGKAGTAPSAVCDAKDNRGMLEKFFSSGNCVKGTRPDPDKKQFNFFSNISGSD